MPPLSHATGEVADEFAGTELDPARRSRGISPGKEAPRGKTVTARREEGPAGVLVILSRRGSRGGRSRRGRIRLGARARRGAEAFYPRPATTEIGLDRCPRTGGSRRPRGFPRGAFRRGPRQRRGSLPAASGRVRRAPVTGGAEVRGHRPPKCSADSARRRFVAGDRTGKPGDAPGDGPLFARVPLVGLEKQLDAVVPPRTRRRSQWSTK